MIDDGKMQLSEGQLDAVAASVFQGFHIDAASGAHVGWLGPLAGFGSGAEQNAATIEQGPSSASSSALGRGFFSIDFLTISDRGKQQGQQQQQTSPPGKSGAVAARTRAQAFTHSPAVAKVKQELGPDVHAKEEPSGEELRRAARAAPAAGSQVAKAKDKAGAGGSSSKGRPKRNLIGDANQIMQEFAEAGPDHKTFFGVGQKAAIQWIQRLVEAFEQRLAEEDDLAADEKPKLVVHKKGTEAVLALCKAARKVGTESSGFLDAALEQTRYLAMSPAVERNLFPAFIRMVAKKVSIECTPVGPEFWKNLAPLQICFGDSSVRMEDVAMLQRDLIANKITSLQEKRDTFATDIATMFADDERFGDAGLCKGDEDQLDALAGLVRCIRRGESYIYTMHI